MSCKRSVIALLVRPHAFGSEMVPVGLITTHVVLLRFCVILTVMDVNVRV